MTTLIIVIASIAIQWIVFLIYQAKIARDHKREMEELRRTYRFLNDYARHLQKVHRWNI